MVAIVIDEEVRVTEYISKLLRKEGLIVYCFNNAIDALEKEIIKSADIIYIEIELKALNGLKFAHILNSINQNCEIIFVSVTGQYALDAYNAGVLDYLLKPVTEELVKRSLLRFHKRTGFPILKEEYKDVTKKKINIAMFGKVSVSTDQMMKSLRFTTAKGAEVFCFMLLQKVGTEVSKWKLMDELWPDKDVNRGNINLRSAVSRLNKTFRENEILIAMKSTRNGYLLEISHEVDTIVDVFMLEDISAKNHILTDDNLLTYEEILLSYNDMLLEDFDSEWCNGYRTLYYRYYKIAAKKLLDYYNRNPQDPLRILSIVEKITKFDPYDEEIKGM